VTGPRALRFFHCAILAITLVFVSRFVFSRMVGRGEEMDEKWGKRIFPKMGERRAINNARRV
jgi:hypothetical protein